MPAPVAPARNPLTGIALKIASVLVFLVMSALLKASEGVPAGELVFFRSFFGLLPVVIFLAGRGELREGVKTRALGNQIGRGLIGTLSMGCIFYSLTKLPLPEAVTINYATPLASIALAALFLGEIVHAWRWSAVIIGFVGVIIIAWPSLTLFSTGLGSGVAIGAVAAILGALFGAVAQTLVRRLILTERPATVVFYFLAVSSLVSLVTLPFGWVLPSPLILFYLVSAGICGGIAQILLTESYRHADMSVIAPFEYTSLIFSVLVGFFFFGDVPTWFMAIGGALVVGSGLFIIYRERKLGIDRAKVEEVVTPQG